jgi:short subunit dehydrogenase-like uncharacterized protein
MPARLLIYGATGYSGKLLARTARERGLAAVLAGRNGAKVNPLARSLGLEGRVFSLEDPWRLAEALRDVDLVLNAAGPFSATAPLLADACLRTGTHYLDLAGEIAVFESLQRRDGEARARQVMLLPGVGINVVASDCLAAHAMKRLPTADRLRIGISRTTLVSRGSLGTIAALASDRVVVRRGGRLAEVPLGEIEHEFDYGRGPRSSMALSWADVFTAGLTTGVDDVAAFVQIDPWQRGLLPIARGTAWLWKSAPGQALARAQTALLAEGPSLEDQKTHRRAVVVEAEDRSGARVCARLRTPEGYWFSTLSSLAIAERALAGEVNPGFQTPARVYGADLVLQLDGVYRDELPA